MFSQIILQRIESRCAQEPFASKHEDNLHRGHPPLSGCRWIIPEKAGLPPLMKRRLNFGKGQRCESNEPMLQADWRQRSRRCRDWLPGGGRPPAAFAAPNHRMTFGSSLPKLRCMLTADTVFLVLSPRRLLKEKSFPIKNPAMAAKDMGRLKMVR